MARRPNYSQERAERERKKAAHRAEKLAARTSRTTKNQLEPGGADAMPGAPQLDDKPKS